MKPRKVVGLLLAISIAGVFVCVQGALAGPDPPTAVQGAMALFEGDQRLGIVQGVDFACPPIRQIYVRNLTWPFIQPAAGKPGIGGDGGWAGSVAYGNGVDEGGSKDEEDIALVIDHGSQSPVAISGYRLLSCLTIFWSAFAFARSPFFS